jgi:hypothetical protein
LSLTWPWWGLCRRMVVADNFWWRMHYAAAR